MTKQQKYTQQQVIDALTKAEGFLSPAARLLGCTTRTIQNYIERYPKVAEVKSETKNKRDDFVEAQIMKRIKEGSDTMTIFYAKTQMKHRGYIEKQEIDHGGLISTQQAQINVYVPDNGRNDRD